MVGLTASIQGSQNHSLYAETFARRSPLEARQSAPGDSVQFSRGALSKQQSYNIVVERSYEKLRSVLDAARAELGLPEGAVIDTSPEATANRIADFALNFFDRFAENHPEIEGDDAKQAFVDLIGPAIQQGIQEARDILSALSALDPEIDSNIDRIGELIQQRLDDFLFGE